MSCRKRFAPAVAPPSAAPCSKRLRRAAPVPLFEDSTDGDFPCHYGDEVVSEKCCFTLLEGLGSGAFGQVVRCQVQPRPNVVTPGRTTAVALKIVKHKDFCEDVSLEAEEEAKILRELKHEHIVQMVDSFEFQGHQCIALELLGRNLYKLIVDHKGLLSIQLVQHCTRQVLSALDYLKRHDVIHGDLKPENVLMVESGWLPGLPDATKPHFKVIDFGGARSVGKGSQEDVVIQTLPYRAPEVLLGLPEWSCAVDIWSMGCICIELFVGESLFDHSSEKDQILEGMVQLLGDIPPWMLKEGSRTHEFFAKERPVGPKRATRPKAGGLLHRIFSWACGLRDAWFHPESAPVGNSREVYKLRRRSSGGFVSAPSLFGAFRRRRFDVVRRYRCGAPQRLVGRHLGHQLRLRRHMETLIRRMLVLDPQRRSDASGCLKLMSTCRNDLKA